MWGAVAGPHPRGHPSPAVMLGAARLEPTPSPPYFDHVSQKASGLATLNSVAQHPFNWRLKLLPFLEQH